ncbi:MAG: protease modulator HflC [Proteobacteria bacterium]|nr:protease modulator HflC [Pseudomonadota bacterium]
MKKVFISIFIGFTVLLLICFSCFSIISKGNIGVLLSFGKPVKVITEPGLYARFPYPFNSMYVLDDRLIMLEPRPAEFLTSDKKNLILENSLCYRIDDPILFMKTVRDQKGLEIRLTDLLSSHTGLLLSRFELSDLVNTDPERIKYDDINSQLTTLLKKDGKTLGVAIKEVFIKRIMLPEVNRFSVFQRMRAERDRIARKYIAEGEEAGQKIRAEADATSRMLIAEAESKALVIRGEAEAKAMKIYGEAYRKNPEFFNFLRSLEAYQKLLNEKSTIVLDDDSPILKPFFSGSGNEK